MSMLNTLVSFGRTSVFYFKHKYQSAYTFSTKFQLFEVKQPQLLKDLGNKQKHTPLFGRSWTFHPT